MLLPCVQNTPLLDDSALYGTTIDIIDLAMHSSEVETLPVAQGQPLAPLQP